MLNESSFIVTQINAGEKRRDIGRKAQHIKSMVTDVPLSCCWQRPFALNDSIRLTVQMTPNAF